MFTHLIILFSLCQGIRDVTANLPNHIPHWLIKLLVALVFQQLEFWIDEWLAGKSF